MILVYFDRKGVGFSGISTHRSQKPKPPIYSADVNTTESECELEHVKYFLSRTQLARIHGRWSLYAVRGW